MKFLCTVEDVLSEGRIIHKEDDDIGEMIQYKIENVSEYIAGISDVDLGNSDVAFNARMACIYGVLAWLESKNIIPSSKDIASLNEGGVSITYQKPQKTHNSHDYNNQYHYYKSFLTRTPPVGSKI